MKRFNKVITGAAVFALPVVASAQIADSANLGPVQTLMTNIVTITNTLLIPFILAIGFLVFVWGMFQYFIAGGANDEKKEAGKSLMIYATLGFVLIIVFWGVINLVANSTGLQNETMGNTPSVVVP